MAMDLVEHAAGLFAASYMFAEDDSAAGAAKRDAPTPSVDANVARDSTVEKRKLNDWLMSLSTCACDVMLTIKIPRPALRCQSFSNALLFALCER
ncbi:hypothetical protein BV22DRAFT_817828 [Leucogyrophana mollusca]|uniref:Uncharacterized protein n=1 Tax=Leucogyrophana mollusca TaxID=85980 RepID=A0ACB8B3T9_9AGAM|nr:hypothetical protein BV22DRAFT_817828 [Leucogyrophana mollusca]